MKDGFQNRGPLGFVGASARVGFRRRDRPSLQTIKTGLAGVVVIEPKLFKDARGFFFATYRAERLAQDAGLAHDLCSLTSRDRAGNILRRVHSQSKHPQTQLCRVVIGEVIEVVGYPASVADLRQSDKRCPVGRGPADDLRRARFYQGFAVLSEVAGFLYQSRDFFAPQELRGIARDGR